MMDMKTSDKFALLVGRVVIAGVCTYAVLAVVKPILEHVQVEVTVK